MWLRCEVRILGTLMPLGWLDRSRLELRQSALENLIGRSAAAVVDCLAGDVDDLAQLIGLASPSHDLFCILRCL